MMPNNLVVYKSYNEPMGISTSCVKCGAPFVDIADNVSKNPFSNNVKITFTCKRCKKVHHIEYEQVIVIPQNTLKRIKEKIAIWVERLRDNIRFILKLWKIL